MKKRDVIIKEIIDLLGGREYTGPIRDMYWDQLNEIFALLDELNNDA